MALSFSLHKEEMGAGLQKCKEIIRKQTIELDWRKGIINGTLCYPVLLQVLLVLSRALKLPKLPLIPNQNDFLGPNKNIFIDEMFFLLQNNPNVRHKKRIRSI